MSNMAAEGQKETSFSTMMSFTGESADMKYLVSCNMLNPDTKQHMWEKSQQMAYAESRSSQDLPQI